ncbi:hypothetical protein, partial [Pseudomonas paraeruginosa]|uniref:hypothetical protein n=1 Tax=Pseudomonas paraeruginosa TaxID=2994495 RepID=UPI003A806DC9
LGAGTNRVPEPGAGSGTAANIKGSVTRSRDNYLENRRSGMHEAMLVHQSVGRRTRTVRRPSGIVVEGVERQ